MIQSLSDFIDNLWVVSPRVERAAHNPEIVGAITDPVSFYLQNNLPFLGCEFHHLKVEKVIRNLKDT
jgi:hypothetical protein